ncbi:MAG TPA: replication-relaxation family protein, partial [Pseudogracilibacillus sp.]|nr:replication-relaxation family protein [Pseudogracilibacillus sp.]
MAELTYATSEQLQLINNLGGNRNARRILFEMEQDNLIKSTMHERKIYYISNKGSDFIGKGNTRLNKTEIQHALMRNDLYIELGMPPTWKKEAKLLVNDKVVLISDARFKRDNRYYFVEIDNK